MGNSQKKGTRRRKDGKKNERGSETKSSTDEALDDLLSKGPIETFYDVSKNIILGKGHYATVHLGICKRTGTQVAVKRIQISKSRVEALQREVTVLKKIGTHPNIVTLFDIFITNSELQLVLELLKGGELFDRMVEKGPYSEQEASHHVRKIGLALQFLHSKGIVHRDLKPENLLLLDKSDDSELKIADFGLSRIVDDVASSTMQTVCGTWAYCAPEVKTSVQMVNQPQQQTNGTNPQGKACYTAAVDLWSVGVILFVILGAYHPFDPDGDASDFELWQRICSGKFDFDDPAWDSISEMAKDLIRRLIVIDPAKRYTTEQLLAHPWVSGLQNIPATPITPSIDKSLGGFVSKKRAMTPKPQFVQGFHQFQQVQAPTQYSQFQGFNPNNNLQHGAVTQPGVGFNQNLNVISNNIGNTVPQTQGHQSTVRFDMSQVNPQTVTQQKVHFDIPEPTYEQNIVFQDQTDVAQGNGGPQFSQENPGLTLDTFASDNDRMELATPR